MSERAEETDDAAPAGPTWALGARSVHLSLAARAGFDALVADTATRRRLGWAHAASVTGSPSAVFFSFDVEAFHGFWMQDVAFDLDLAFLDDTGVVLALHRLSAGTLELVYPPEPIRYALELPAGEAAALGLAGGDRVLFERDAVAPVHPEHPPEPPITPDPRDEPALIERWGAREHFYSSRNFAAACALMGRPMRVGPDDIAIWLHAGGGYVVHPPLCPLAPLEALARALGLAWLRLELAPRSRLLLPDGRIVVEAFDPRHPDDWLARMRGHGLYPTVGRWQQTRTQLVDVAGDEAQALARMPTRIRYEARTFQRAVAEGRLRVEAVPRAAFDRRQQRAVERLHGEWLAAHPDAEDNLTFCDPMALAFQDALTGYLCWRGEDLLAVQYHVLWHQTLYYLFSECVRAAPQGLTPGLIWHGVCAAKAAPFGPSGAPDVLDLVGVLDPRYPEFRAFARNYTPAKLRWHGTNVWLPPSVAFPGLELPP